MVYINDNNKLADLLEKLLKPETLTNADIVDTKDLITDLRSNKGEVSLVADCDKYHHSI
jgi:hypothetical protein